MFISRNDDSVTYHLSHIGNNMHQHFKKISRTICGFNYWAICSFLSEVDENTRSLLLVWGFCQTWKHTAHYYIVRDTFQTMQQRFWFHPPNYKWLKNDYYSPIWHLPSPRHPPPLPSPLKDACPQLSDWVFWLPPDVDQTPVNNTGQVTPSRLAFCFFIFLPVLSFPFCCACILCTLDQLR